MNAPDCLNLISKTINDMMNFATEDKELEKDFREYLEINNVEIKGPKSFTDILLQYLFDMKMQNGLRVIEYFRRKNKSEDGIIEALANSFCGIFKINKILSNAYEVTCLSSDVVFELIPMVKMHHLKQIGKNDFIKARILSFQGNEFLLEIYDVISELNVAQATTEAIKLMLQSPKSAYYKNNEKKKLLEKSVENFYEKFKELFKKDFIVTTNKHIDKLIETFNIFRQNNEIIPYDDLIEEIECDKFLDIEELNCTDDNFITNAIGGFKSHKETYDIALWMDKSRGLYIIPFLKTFFNCFEKDVENKAECIKEFLTSDKIPPSVLKYAYNNNENFLNVINSTLHTKFKTFEELLFNTKTAFIDSGIYSPVIVLFNSELFSNLIEV